MDVPSCLLTMVMALVMAVPFPCALRDPHTNMSATPRGSTITRANKEKNEKKHTQQHNEIPHGRLANTLGNKLVTLPAGVDVEGLPSFRPRPGTFINHAVFAGGTTSRVAFVPYLPDSLTLGCSKRVSPRYLPSQ
ncbi:hypothetical protein E2C01_096391 [Portunus trituberculatus]|uniref:Secreted protein n=1 Tax=Portunus trituberculatus TaxID=210409 RepID=A0A5B7K1W8_PORTR|nr:hypothetical protein [Portunus trituberculatus]